MLAVSDRLADERSVKNKDKSKDSDKKKDTDAVAKQKNVLPKPKQDTVKLDSDTKARYIKEGRCFGCGQTGHLSMQYPSKDRAAVVAEVAAPTQGLQQRELDDAGKA